MKHLGDITKINGAEVEPVEVIIGGSPCQDLSVAGKRAGLDGERSGLFMEQIRIIKEMRENDRANGRSNDTVRPQFMVFENVPGVFSSKKGEDFRIVLEETAKIADPEISIPRPPQGKWTNAGAIMGNGFSIAWRVLDAQYFGVPQRRRRIALVADFGGESAPEILFERESLSRNIEPSGTQRQGTAGDAERGVDNAICCGINGDISETLDASYYKGCGERQGVERTVVYDARGNGSGDLAPTITGDHQDRVTDYTALCIGNGQMCNMSMKPIANSLDTMHDQQAVMTWGLDRAAYNQGKNAKYNFSVEQERIGAQVAKGPGAIATQSIVRRLTPLEVERLQGYPIVRKVRFTKMTKDEYIAWNINEGNIVVNTEYGKVFATRGPGGVKLDEPKELTGSIVNGYRVVSIRNGKTKMQCRVHRIVWIAEHGVIPDGYVIDHINNDKQDNRRCNLQLLTAAQNSTKARSDGLYKIHGDSASAKISDEVHDFIQQVYENTDLTCKQLSEIFGISKSRVNQIIHDEPWTDIGDWTDTKGKKHNKAADSPRYKALGNSIAIPCWRFILEAISDRCTERTMASLFDGIGGYPLIWEQINGSKSCRWVSEIEEFPIAVTKIRFEQE